MLKINFYKYIYILESKLLEKFFDEWIIGLLGKRCWKEGIKEYGPKLNSKLEYRY